VLVAAFVAITGSTLSMLAWQRCHAGGRPVPPGNFAELQIRV
jgi:hypothetical protein